MTKQRLIDIANEQDRLFQTLFEEAWETDLQDTLHSLSHEMLVIRDELMRIAMDGGDQA